MTAIARYLSPVRLFTLVVVAALLFGYTGHLERYITPERGLGYALGIVGGSLMLVVLLYPARKRAEWLKFIGGVAGWFRMHTVLGVVGPLIVLYHANFKLGATNSNVALYCMFLVAGSGLIGRYIWGRIYGGYANKQSTLAELQAAADQLRRQTSTVAVLPEMLGVIEAEEKRLFKPASTRLGAIFFPITMGLRSLTSDWRVKRKILQMVASASRTSPTLAAHGPRLTKAAMGYAKRRLEANRRVAEHRVYVKMFSLWHFAHVPFFIMLLVAGIVHVISVHVY